MTFQSDSRDGRVKSSLSCLLYERLQADLYFMAKIITGDESSLYGYDPESNFWVLNGKLALKGTSVKVEHQSHAHTCSSCFFFDCEDMCDQRSFQGE